MRLRRHLLLLLVLTGLGSLTAQDIHFSQYNLSPLTLNPALAGSFEGTARIGGIYRDQWGSFLRNQFVTPSFYIDAPVVRGLRKNDWIGVGLVVITDKAGTSELKTGGSLLTGAYHLALDKNRKNMLTLGFQGGRVTRSVNLSAEGLKFADELPTQVGGGGLGVGAGADRNLTDQKSYFDLAAGVMLRSQMDEKNHLELGFAAGHITQPAYGFGGAGGGTGGGSGNSASKRPMRLTLHGTLVRKMTEELSIEPSFLVQNTKTATEIAVQALAGLRLREDVVLRFGPGYRFGDAVQLFLGVDYENLRAGISYDINASKLSSVSNYQGGFELGAYYIFKVYTKPDVPVKILCPAL